MASRTPQRASAIVALPSPAQSLRLASRCRLLHSSGHHGQQAQQQPPQQQAPPAYERTKSPLQYQRPENLVHVRPQPRAPVPVRTRKPFAVNDDPRRLDEMYAKLLGEEITLPESVKWQAVTHKSFDHGRQPFNEKLAFLGKRILKMHISLHLLTAPVRPFSRDRTPKRNAYTSAEGVEYQRPEPFVHEDYVSLLSVTRNNIDYIFHSHEIASLLSECDLVNVLRWKPAESISDIRSGKRKVALDSLCAIVGAVALQKGGDVAGRFVRERILSRMDKSWKDRHPKDPAPTETEPSGAES